MLIERKIRKKIENLFFKGKAIIIYGPRQVGKTTLIKQMAETHKDISVYFNCDEPDISSAFEEKNSSAIKFLFGNKKLIFIDEAQKIRNVGSVIKLIVDSFPDIQIVATGSSSFELSEKIVEPLTGRKFEFILYPLSIEEISQVYSRVDIMHMIDDFIVFGTYPEIVFNREIREKNLMSIAKSYSYKDVLKFDNIKNPEVLDKLLKALALQIGNEVSYNELADTVGVDKNTVAKYIQILEKAFIIYRVGPFSRNLRSEIKKMRKIYFLDTGIRNAIINNLNGLDMRNDSGFLFENYFINERIKYNAYRENYFNYYYWRTKDGKEIDFIEELGGKVEGYEIKMSPKVKYKIPEVFINNYKNVNVNVVNKSNFLNLIL
jgi:predicted AAA+ superfamily ATPase